MTISKNIKYLREKYKLTQAELGKIAGVSDKAVSSWENGTAEPRMGAIQKMADYFGVEKSVIIADNLNESKFDKELDKLMRKISQLDEIDRAKLEERVDIMLEDDKYKKIHHGIA